MEKTLRITIKAGIICCLFCIVTCLGVTGCGKEDVIACSFTKEVREYLYPDDSIQDVLDAYKESAYSYSDYNVQGDTLILYISKEKYDDLLENVKQELEDEKEILTDKKPTYHLEYGEEYGEVSYYIDSSIDAEWFQWRDIVIRQTCAGYRVLKGFENYHPVVKIFNCHTGKLVGEQDETGAININANDW